MIKILLLAIVMASITGVTAQNRWELSDCFKYAIDNSRELKINSLYTKLEQEELKEAKGSYLPSLNARSSLALNFGRSIDPETNTISFESSYSNSIRLYSSVDIFNGFQRSNIVKAQKYAVAAGLENEIIERNRILFEVAEAYYNLQYSDKLYDVAKMQLQLSKLQLNRIEKMLQVGTVSNSEKIELESKVSSSKLNEVTVLGDREVALQKLSTLLNIDKDTLNKHISHYKSTKQNIDMNLTDIDVEELYKRSKIYISDIKMAEIEVNKAERYVASSKGATLPSLYISAGVSSAYNDRNSSTYSEQLNNNMNQYMEATVTIPIFNRLTNRTEIDRAKLNLDIKRFQLLEIERTLYNEIESRSLNYNRSVNRYIASTDNEKFCRISFMEVNKKFELGMANITELSSAQTKLEEALIELCRADIDIKIQNLWLQYYRTGKLLKD